MRHAAHMAWTATSRIPVNRTLMAHPAATAAIRDQPTPGPGSSSQRVNARTMTAQHARKTGSDSAMRKLACVAGNTPTSAAVATPVAWSVARATIDLTARRTTARESTLTRTATACTSSLLSRAIDPTTSGYPGGHNTNACDVITWPAASNWPSNEVARGVTSVPRLAKAIAAAQYSTESQIMPGVRPTVRLSSSTPGATAAIADHHGRRSGIAGDTFTTGFSI